jgi:hypothetical protein
MAASELLVGGPRFHRQHPDDGIMRLFCPTGQRVFEKSVNL